MTTFNTCGQQLPPEPVYVGPGDRVEYKLTLFKVVGMSHLYDGRIVIEGVLDAQRVRLDELRTPDGRSVAGFKDPRDERIKELEAQVSEYVAWCDDLQDQLSSSTNPLAGLSDEQLVDIARNYRVDYSYPTLKALYDIRDGKLEVPR